MTPRRGTNAIAAAVGPRLLRACAAAAAALVLGMLTPALGSAHPVKAPPANTWMAVGGDPLARALKQARRFAACERRHGFPDLPKPKVVGNEVRLLLPPGVSRNAPRLKAARDACQKHLKPPKGGSTNIEGEQ